MRYSATRTTGKTAEKYPTAVIESDTDIKLDPSSAQRWLERFSIGSWVDRLTESAVDDRRREGHVCVSEILTEPKTLSDSCILSYS